MATPICACVLRLVSSMTHLCVYVAMVALVGNLFLTLHVRVVDAATSSSASGTTIRHAAPLLESAIRTNVQECMRKMQQTNVGHEPETDWQTCSDECYTQYRTLNRTIDTKRNLTSMFTADPAFAAKVQAALNPFLKQAKESHWNCQTWKGETLVGTQTPEVAFAYHTLYIKCAIPCRQCKNAVPPELTESEAEIAEHVVRRLKGLAFARLAPTGGGGGGDGGGDAASKDRAARIITEQLRNLRTAQQSHRAEGEAASDPPATLSPATVPGPPASGPTAKPSGEPQQGEDHKYSPAMFRISFHVKNREVNEPLIFEMIHEFVRLVNEFVPDSGPRPGVSWFKIPTFTAPDTLLFQVCHPWSMMNGARGQAGPIQQFVEKYVQYLDDRLPPFQEKMSLPPSPAPTDRWKTFFSFASYSTGTSFGVGVCNTLAIIEKFIVSRPTLFNPHSTSNTTEEFRGVMLRLANFRFHQPQLANVTFPTTFYPWFWYQSCGYPFRILECSYADSKRPDSGFSIAERNAIAVGELVLESAFRLYFPRSEAVPVQVPFALSDGEHSRQSPLYAPTFFSNLSSTLRAHEGPSSFPAGELEKAAVCFNKSSSSKWQPKSFRVSALTDVEENIQFQSITQGCSMDTLFTFYRSAADLNKKKT